MLLMWVGRLVLVGWVTAIVFLWASAASAVTFDYSVSASQVIVGPDTILALDFGPQSITLTPNVAATAPIIPTNQNTIVTFPSIAETINSTLPGRLVFDGVTTNFSRPFTLTTTFVPPPCCPNIVELGLMTFSAISFTVDLGADGKVDIAAPQVATGGGGYNVGDAHNSFLLVVPFQLTTVLLHDVPTTVPEPSSLLLVVTGFSGLGLYASRSFARSR
jgi:hypothetical protein